MLSHSAEAASWQEARRNLSRTREEVLGAWSEVPVGVLELLQAFVYGGLEKGTEEFNGSPSGISD